MKRSRRGQGEVSRPAHGKQSSSPGVQEHSRFSDISADEKRPGLASRLVAAKLLAAVVETRTSLDGLTDPNHGHPQFRKLPPRDQALVRALLQTSLRFRGTIESAISSRLERPLPKKASALRHILHVGAAQILFLDVPDSAAVDLAVASAQADPRVVRFAGLVNAILRRLSREQASEPAGGMDARTGLDCPAWLMTRLVAQYGDRRAEAIAVAHRSPAPLDITVKSDVTGWAAKLGGRVVGPRTVRIDSPERPVGDLEGFDDGQWWVQNLAASLPARLFGELKGKTAIDLCAAPGGKTAQLCLAGARVTALDISRSRMKRLQQNLARLQLSADTLVSDIADFKPDTPFDAVLLDAPCSSTGTIRRHPDVAYTKNDTEIEKLAQIQARLLSEAARLVAPGGTLVFSNCSLDRAEGESVVEAFLDTHREFRRLPVATSEMPELAQAISPIGDLRTTPDLQAGDAGGLDGFYAARLIRQP